MKPYIAVLVLMSIGVQAAPPGIIGHSGRVTVGGVNFNGTGHFKATLWLGPGAPPASLATRVLRRMRVGDEVHYGLSYSILEQVADDPSDTIDAFLHHAA